MTQRSPIKDSSRLMPTETVAALNRLEPRMKLLLQQAIAHPSISGAEGPFTRFIETWACGQGLESTCWVADEKTLAAYPPSRLRHLPLADRPTLVLRLPGQGKGKSILFNAHADVVAAGESRSWRFDPWSGTEQDGRIYGRGAADAKGPLISALWAMAALRQAWPRGLEGDVLLELVPGEEDCVGLGTLTSLARGFTADAVIVLEPSSCRPQCASRGGCRFEITCHGVAVHGTVKWLGVDAIQMMRSLLEVLADIERQWNDRQADPLFAEYPIARPITVDSVHGGLWQGMICDHCLCAGYLELLPADELEAMKQRFEREVRDGMRARWPAQAGALSFRFSEQYPGHRTPPGHPLCALAAQVAASELSACNSGCEAGLRAALENAPTLVWGPGDLSQAHAVDEFIQFSEVKQAAGMFASLVTRWTTWQE